MIAIKLCIFSLLMFSILLAACNSDGIVVSPSITVGGQEQEIGYIGYVADQSEVDNNEPPSIYQNVEPYTIKPNTIIELNYDEIPKMVLKQWANNKLEKEEELPDFSFTSPGEEGIYIYSIGQRWKFRAASSVVIVLNVKR